ncbi:MAG: right-handed parallel beta-helix repeat-containing protein, partial [Patescibacteria group bacterium]
IENIIQLSTDKVRPDLYTSDANGWNINVGYGRVNARKALNLLRAPVAFTQETASGGGTVAQTINYAGYFYGLPGAPDGYYIGKRYEIQKAITFPLNSWRKVWGRGIATTGYNWSPNNTNFTMGYCEVVPGTLTSTGATLRTWVYEISKTNGSNYGYYPTTPSNATFAYTVLAVPTTISTNSTLDGNFVFDDIVTVNSGVTLTVTPGSVISFASGKSMVVNGVLNANGTSSQLITFTATAGTTPGSWGSIILDGSGASGSNLNYVNIEYGTGIQILNGANVVVQNSTIENNTYGIYFYNSAPQILNNYIRYNSQHAINGTTNGSSPKIYDNTITRTGTKNYAGILLTGTHGNIIHNDVSGFDVGMFFLGGSNPYFTRSTGTTPNPNNRIQLCNNGIEAAWGSNPILGNFEVIPTWGRSSVYNNSNTNIYARNYSYVVADLNWFGCENTNLHFDSTSEIYA